MHIIVQGTTTGTTTEANGSYSIKVNGNDAVLVFQSLSYETQTIPVGSRTDDQRHPERIATKIADVVVTALGLTREREIAGMRRIEGIERCHQCLGGLQLDRQHERQGGGLS